MSDVNVLTIKLDDGLPDGVACVIERIPPHATMRINTNNLNLIRLKKEMAGAGNYIWTCIEIARKERYIK